MALLDDAERPRAGREDVHPPVGELLEHARDLHRAADRVRPVGARPRRCRTRRPTPGTRRSSCGSAPRRCAAGRSPPAARRGRAGRAGSRGRRGSGISSECTVGPYQLDDAFDRDRLVPRDLRVHDHPALAAAAASTTGRAAVRARRAAAARPLRERPAHRVHAREPARARRRAARRGGALCVRAGRPEDVVAQVAREVGAGAVHWTSDVSPFARRRDAAVTAALRAGRRAGAARTAAPTAPTSRCRARGPAGR